jgi:hypothetical protein
MPKSRKDTNVETGKKSKVAATSSTTRGRETKEEQAAREKEARKLKLCSLNAQDRRDIFERWRATPFLRDKMRSLKPRERKPVPNIAFFMRKFGYGSVKSFLLQYSHYVQTGETFESYESACAAGNTPLLSPELLKKGSYRCCICHNDCWRHELHNLSLLH